MGQAIDAVTELGFGLYVSDSIAPNLRSCWHELTTVAQRLVYLSAHPLPMQHDRWLSRHRDYGSFFPILPAALGQLQPPPQRAAACLPASEAGAAADSKELRLPKR